MKKTKIIFMCTLIFMFIINVVPAQATLIWSNCHLVYQDQSQFCWAASAQMLTGARGYTCPYSQLQFAQYIYPNALKNYPYTYNMPASAADMAKATTYESRNLSSYAAHSCTYSDSQVQPILAAGYGIAALSFGPSNGHSFVIAGYDTSTGEVELLNPDSGSTPFWITISMFVNSGATSGGYKWTQSVW